MSDERGVTVSRPQPLARAPDPQGRAPAAYGPSGRPAPGRTIHPQFPDAVRRQPATPDRGEDRARRLSEHTRQTYPENWGRYKPSNRDFKQWDRAVEVAVKVGVTPKQLAALRDAMLEDAPDVDEGQDGDYEPDDYSVPFSIPDDASWGTFKLAREIAAEHGVSPAAFSEMAAAVLGANEAISEPQMRRAQIEKVDELVAQHGDRALVLVKNAMKAVEHFGARGLKRLLETPMAGGVRFGDSPELIETFANVGRAIAYDARDGEFASSSGVYQSARNKEMNGGRYSVSASTQQAAKAAIVKLEREHPSHGASYRYPEVQAERDRLYRLAYPEPEES